mgnify:CR=1 FL=1
MSLFNSTDPKNPIENVVAVMKVFDTVDEKTTVRKLITQVFPAETPASKIIEWGQSSLYHGTGNIILTIPEDHLSLTGEDEQEK